MKHGTLSNIMGHNDENNPLAERGVLAHVCSILDCFTPEKAEMGVRELARMADMSPSTTGRLLQSMRERGILRQDPETKTYSLGIRLLNWTGVYLSALDIRAIAMPVMADLQASTLETISLYVLDGTDRVCVERLESPQRVRIVARLGLRLPLYAGSAGKVILAYLSTEQTEQILTTVPLLPFTRHTITDAAKLREELAIIQARGYAFSHGEWIEDASGVAAPIFGHDNQVAGALTISGPSQRFDKEVIERYGQQLIPAGREISRAMGSTSNSSYMKDRTRS